MLGKEENPLSELTPDSLTLRDGCAVTLTMMEYGVYEGSTTGDNCESDLRGAKYATSSKDNRRRNYKLGQRI
ncbi:MAG: CpcT/CpeT family chromophore lyase [Ignavibacteria bacterium]